MALSTTNRDRLNNMCEGARGAGLGTQIYGLKFTPDSVSGTILAKQYFAPAASAATTGVNYHKLFAIGDVTGNTAYGFGDPAKPTTGLMACFGRTAVATGNITDTGLDVRAINKLTNTGTNNIQGAYIKAKNYDTGTVGGDLIGAYVETVNDGTVTGKVIGLKLGKDTGTMTADIQFTNGQYLIALSTAITANSTTTASPAGSIGITTNATGVGKLFVSDGSKWQYASVSS
jgi:hypothetical protein